MFHLKRKQLSDDEYVAEVRRNISKGRKIAAIFAVFWSVMLIFAVSVTLYPLRRILAGSSTGLPAAHHAFWLGCLLGFTWMFALSGIVVQLVFNVFTVLGVASRQTELMLKYYDFSHPSVSHKLDEGKDANPLL